MPKTFKWGFALLPIALLLGVLMPGCSGEPSNEELIQKYNDLPSNNPDVSPPPNDQRAAALGGGPGRKGAAAGK